MNQERLLQIILSQHISEKSTRNMEKNNEFTFKVIKDAHKDEVKDAVESLFNVKVKAVRVVKVRAKQKMFKGMEGKKKGWKKAYVTLYPDQKLEMMGVGA